MADSTGNHQQQSLRSNQSVAVIVPVTGHSPSLYDQLKSIFDQEHPFEKMICVTDTEDDPAVAVIRKIQQNDARVHHVCAGKAVQCSQKNHNLLAGYRALTNFTGVLVFCDAGHTMTRQWLKNLLRPLQDTTEITISSGYHHVIPENTDLCATCRAVIVQALCSIRKIPAVNQPWGGATAMTSKEFVELQLAELWADTVVDDVVLAGRLKERKKIIAIVGCTDVATYVQDSSYWSLCQWLIRQWAYLKYVFYKTWLVLGLGGILFTALLYAAMAILGSCLFLTWPTPIVAVSIILVLTFLLFCLYLRRQHPSPGPPAHWYLACFLSTLVAGWCHAQLWGKDEIVWAGIRYSVDKKGKVLTLKRDG